MFVCCLTFLLLGVGCSEKPDRTNELPDKEARQSKDKAAGVDDRSKARLTLVRIRRVMSALEMYKMSIGSYPNAGEALTALIEKPDFDDERLGQKWGPRPYIDAGSLSDMWGSPLLYRLDEEKIGGRIVKVARVWSPGPNREDEDGAGDDVKGW